MPRPLQAVGSAGAVTLLHGGSLGDFLLALRLLQRVDGLPGGSNVRRAVARSPMSALPHASLRLDVLLDSDRVGMHRLFAADAPVCDALRQVLADSSVVIDMLALRGAAKARLEALTGGAVVSLDPRPSDGCRDHIIDQWRRRLPAAIGYDATGPEPLISIDPRNLAASPMAVLHPGSGGRSKRWPIDRFIALADRLRAGGLEPAFMLGPTELDWHGDEWRRMLREHAPVTIEGDLWLAAQRMAAAALYVGNDAGSTHLAAAVGAPTIALFGPTDPRVWSPIGRRVRVVAPPEESCAVDGISVDCVLDACHELVGRG